MRQNSTASISMVGPPEIEMRYRSEAPITLILEVLRR
jgi:hypothetical protein